jgi:hypothetical protein
MVSIVDPRSLTNLDAIVYMFQPRFPPSGEDAELEVMPSAVSVGAPINPIS